MLYVFDIDGTLADITHRRHLVATKPKNWPAFEARAPQDKPVWPIIAVLTELWKGDHDIVIASGRGDNQRDATVRWLAQVANVPRTWYDLYMRRAGDYRADDIIKQEILNAITAKYGRKPDMVFDDRKRVVDMWRRNGILVAQVDEGDF